MVTKASCTYQMALFGLYPMDLGVIRRFGSVRSPDSTCSGSHRSSSEENGLEGALTGASETRRLVMVQARDDGDRN